VTYYDLDYDLDYYGDYGNGDQQEPYRLAFKFFTAIRKIKPQQGEPLLKKAQKLWRMPPKEIRRADDARKAGWLLGKLGANKEEIGVGAVWVKRKIAGKTKLTPQRAMEQSRKYRSQQGETAGIYDLDYYGAASVGASAFDRYKPYLPWAIGLGLVALTVYMGRESSAPSRKRRSKSTKRRNRRATKRR
jgi:hypothetical protein